MLSGLIFLGVLYVLIALGLTPVWVAWARGIEGPGCQGWASWDRK